MWSANQTAVGFVAYLNFWETSCYGYYHNIPLNSRDLCNPRVLARGLRMADKSVLGPFWGLASADKDKQLQSAKELISLLQNCQVIISNGAHRIFTPMRLTISLLN